MEEDPSKEVSVQKMNLRFPDLYTRRQSNLNLLLQNIVVQNMAMVPPTNSEKIQVLERIAVRFKENLYLYIADDEAPPNADALHEASGSGPKTKQNLTNAEEPKVIIFVLVINQTIFRKTKRMRKRQAGRSSPRRTRKKLHVHVQTKKKLSLKRSRSQVNPTINNLYLSGKRPIKPTQHFFPPPSDDLQENDSPVEGDSSSPSQDPYLSYIFATPQTIKSPATRRNVGPVPVSASHLHSVSMSSTSTTSTTSTTKTAASFRPSPHQPSKETTEHETTKAEDKDKFYTPMSTMNKKNPRTPSTRTSVESTPRNKPLNFSSDESFGTPNYSKIDKSSGSSNNG